MHVYIHVYTSSTCTYSILQACVCRGMYICVYVALKKSKQLSDFLNTLQRIFLASHKIELEGRHYQNTYFENVSIISPKDYAYAV